MAREQFRLILLITLCYALVNIADTGKPKGKNKGPAKKQSGAGKSRREASEEPPKRYRSSGFNESDTVGPWAYRDKKNGIRAYAVKGRRSVMADRFRVIDDNGYLGFGLFDGARGSETAQDAADHLLPALLDAFQKYSETMSYTEFGEVIQDVIDRYENETMHNDKLGNSGTTALIALLHGDDLYTITIGNGKIVGKVTGVEETCQFNDESLIRTGPPPIMDAFIRNDPSRTKMSLSRRSGCFKFNGIDTDRMLGPIKKSEPWVIPNVGSIYLVALEMYHVEYLVMSTKGLWNRCSNDYVANYIAENMNTKFFGADSLAQDLATDGYYTDNVSIIVVKFPPKSDQ